MWSNVEITDDFGLFYFQVHWPFCVSVCSVLLLQDVQYVGCLTNNWVLRLYLSHLLCILLNAGNCFLFCISAFRAIHLCKFKNGLIGKNIKYKPQDLFLLRRELFIVSYTTETHLHLVRGLRRPAGQLLIHAGVFKLYELPVH